MNDCIYDSNSFKYLKVKKLIGFLHAFTGCDTTFGFFKHDENKLIKTLSDDAAESPAFLRSHRQSCASANDIVSQMYGSKKDKKTTRAVVF